MELAAIASPTPVTPALGVDLAPSHPAGLRLRNPVLTASGTFGFGDEYLGIVNYAALGAIVTKTVTPQPREGNPTPRTVETPAGMLNSIGLPNTGYREVFRQKRSLWRDLPCPVVVSIAADSPTTWADLAAAASDLENVVGIEANLSCPNVAGLDFATDGLLAGRMVEATLNAARLPVIAKLSPNVTDIRPIAQAVESAGAQAISLINTLVGMVVDTTSRRPFLGNRIGGLSGPAIRPVAVRLTYQVAAVVKIPVIGIGGVATLDDALQFFLAGARAVQVGTATFRNPLAAETLVAELHAYCAVRGLTSIESLIGAAHLGA